MVTAQGMNTKRLGSLGAVLEAGYHRRTPDLKKKKILDAFIFLMVSQIMLISSFFKLTLGVEYMGDKRSQCSGEIPYIP